MSILGPTEPLADPGALEAGVDGLIVERDGHRALLLPEVATEFGWNRSEILGAVCRKSGLPIGALAGGRYATLAVPDGAIWRTGLCRDELTRTLAGSRRSPWMRRSEDRIIVELEKVGQRDREGMILEIDRRLIRHALPGALGGRPREHHPSDRRERPVRPRSEGADHNRDLTALPVRDRSPDAQRPAARWAAGLRLR